MTIAQTAKRVIAALSPDQAEAERLEKRRAIRRELATLANDERKAAQLRLQLKELDRRADLAADEHQEICQPAQARIREIDDQIVATLAERESVPARLESE